MQGKAQIIVETVKSVREKSFASILIDFNKTVLKERWHAFFSNSYLLPKIIIMITDNNSLSENDNIKKDQNNDTVIVQGTKFTKEEIEQANKPQRNVILDTIGGSGIGSSDSDTDFRDTERVNTRANEAPDSTDTNTGGIAAGGAKGANQS